MKNRHEGTKARRHEVRTGTRHTLFPSCLRAFVPPYLLLCAGCSHLPNQFREDGPAAVDELESPTSIDVYARFTRNEQRDRGWNRKELVAESGGVTHWPLYFEDPFEDKGSGRMGRNKYYLGWEDVIAVPYCYARFTLNWIATPVSMVVQPPWMVMESDGEMSKQALGYDHDAAEYVAHRPNPEPQATESGDPQSQPAE